MRAAHVPLEAAAGNQRSSYGESPPRGRGRADKTGTGRLRKPCIAPCAGRLHRNSAGPGISQRRVLRHRRAYGDAGPYPAEIPAKASGKAGCGGARHSAQRAVSGALSEERACACGHQRIRHAHAADGEIQRCGACQCGAAPRRRLRPHRRTLLQRDRAPLRGVQRFAADRRAAADALPGPV